MDGSPLTHFAGSMEAILEAAGAGKVVEACNRLSAALEAAALPPASDLPEGIRENFIAWPPFSPFLPGKKSFDGRRHSMST
jgi:hypothetical protein